MEAAIPVIDLLNLPAENWKLLAACEGIGCFRVINHGIPRELQSEMRAAVNSLFDLPDGVKGRNADVIPGRGYNGLSDANPVFEAFGLYDPSSSTDVDRFCSQLEASPPHKEVIKSYISRLHLLIMDIACKLAESLGVADYSFDEWPCLLRMNKYHFTGKNVGSSGILLHSDSGFLTILQEDDTVSGLEIMDPSGTFLAVNPFPGSFLVNLGDMGKAWSNGRLHNVKHRVLCKKAAVRQTIAFFMLAPKSDIVEPPEELMDSEHPRLYQTFTYKDYVNLMLSTRSFTGETLSLLALPLAPTENAGQ